MQVTSYKDLEVWQKSRELAQRVYQLTSRYPKTEQYGLVDQIKRAVVSIVANIAEGKQRQTLKEYIQFLYMSYGSCSELEALLILSEDFKFVKKTDLVEIVELLTQIQKMLNTMIKKLKTKVLRS